MRHKSGTVGIIPARWASSRFPGKPLAPIHGKPLLHWVVARVRKSVELDGLLVATDDERVRECAEETGVDVVMTRSDHPSGTDRIAEAIERTDADSVINIQGDEPFISPALIDSIALVLKEEAALWDMVTAAEPIDDESEINNPNAVKVVFNNQSQALYFSRSPIPCQRNERDEEGIVYWRHVGIYGYRREFLNRYVKTPPSRLEKVERLEQLRAFEIGARMKVIETRESGLGIDRPEDIQSAEKMIEKGGDI